jgi:hypothetical protein
LGIILVSKEDEREFKESSLWQELKMISRKQTKIFTKLIVSSTYLTSWSAAGSGDGMVGFSRGPFRTTSDAMALEKYVPSARRNVSKCFVWK